jgi:small subunit ribosomal protein S20
MPVSKSAKKALTVAHRRHEENLITRSTFKRAAKEVRKAVTDGLEGVAALFTIAQSKLDRAAKNNTIHANKAARLKSRLAKRILTAANAPVEEPKKKAPAKKAATPRKTTTKKKEA